MPRSDSGDKPEFSTAHPVKMASVNDGVRHDAGIAFEELLLQTSNSFEAPLHGRWSGTRYLHTNV
jgi:hypothetical protein